MCPSDAARGADTSRSQPYHAILPFGERRNAGDHRGNFAWEDALPYVIRSNPRVASRTARPRWYRAMALRVVRESVAALSICCFKVRIIAL
jgi:hypothetical protein